MYNRNAAYDFGVLEEHKKHGRVVKLPGQRARQKERLKSQRKVLAGLFSMFLVVAGGVSAFVMGQVKLTEVTDQTEKAAKELDECESSNMQLRMQLESQNIDGIKNAEIQQTDIVRIPKEVVTVTH